MKRFLYEENMKFLAGMPETRTWRPGVFGWIHVFGYWFCGNVFQRADAVGRSRRTAHFIAAAGGGTGVPGGTAAVPQNPAMSAVVVSGFRLGPADGCLSYGGRTFGAPVAIPAHGATPRSACGGDELTGNRSQVP